MKSRLNYKARKNAIATVIVIILLILTFISTYVFVKARIDSQAATEERGMTGNRAENITTGEQETKTENNTNTNNEQTVGQQETNTNNNTTNNTVNSAVQTANTNVAVPTQTNVVTRTETQVVENEVVLVGFNQSEINIDTNSLSATGVNLPKIARNIVATTKNNTNAILNGDEITYTITIANESEEQLEQVNVSAVIPEGTQLVEGSISDNGIIENEKISWKVDVDTEKSVSYTVKVIKEEGIVTANAVVEGIETQSVQTPIVKTELVIDNNQVNTGDTITYTIKIENTAEMSADINVEAVVPEKTELETEGLNVEEGTIKWNKALEALESIEYSYTVKVTEYEKDYTIENTVKVNGSNSNTVNSAIVDTTIPTLNFNNGAIVKEYTVEAVDENFAYMTVQNMKTGEIKKIEETTFTLPNEQADNVRYDIIAYDKAGNASKKQNIYHDNVKPVITGTGKKDKESELTNNEIYKEVTLKVTDGSLKKVLNGEESLAELEDNYVSSKVMSYEKKFTAEGTYTITAIDRAGIKNTITFTIDRTKPEISGVENQKYYNTDVTPVVKDDNLRNVKVKLEGVEDFYKHYKLGDTLTKEGKYTLVATDKAMNKTEEITFVIDKTAPTFENLTSGTHFEKEIPVKVNDANFAYVEVYNQDEGKTYQKNEKEFKLLEEATYKLIAVDLAGNKSNEVWVAIDNTAPKIEGLEDGKEFYNSDVTLTISDKFLTKVTVNGEEITGIEKDSKNENGKIVKTFEQEGTYTVVATDKYGHETPKTFTIDKTAPQRVYSTIRVKSGTPEENKDGVIYYYVKNGSSFEFAISFNEELKANPIAVIGNKEIELKLNEKVKNNESKYLYEGTLEIAKNESELPEGLLEIKVKNIVDFAGNEATREIETNQTRTSNSRSVIYDRTAPKVASANLYANVTANVTTYYVNDEKTITANVKTNEELGTNPKFTFHNNGKDYVVESTANGKDDKENYEYYAQIKTTELTDGEVTFTASPITDKAGNKTADVIKVSNSNKVIVDKTPAKISSSDFYANGVTNSYPNEEGQWIYVNTGKTIVVNAKFDEELMQNPIIVLKDAKNKEYKLEVINRGPDEKGKYLYQATHKIEETMAEGEIKYTISEIYDKAGNKTEDITKATNSRRIVYDKTAPKATYLIVKNYSGENAKYAKEGDEVTVKVNFVEKLAEAPVLNIYGKNQTMDIVEYKNEDGTFKYCQCSAKIKMTADMQEGKIQFTINNIKDLAGNTITLNNDNIIADANGGEYVIFDLKAPEVEYENASTGPEKDPYKYYTVTANDEINYEKLMSYPKLKDEFDENPTVKIEHVDLLIGGVEENIYKYDYSNGLDTKYGKGRYNIYYEVEDAAGNKAIKTLLIFMNDKNAPTLSIDSSSIGSQGVYSKMVVNATDTSYLAYYEINGMKSTIDKDSNGKPYLTLNHSRTFLKGEINGHIKFNGEKNTIVVYDKAGNKSNVIEFIADQTAPECTGLRVIGGEPAGSGTFYAKNGDNIQVYVKFNEELSVAPLLKINGIDNRKTTLLGKSNKTGEYGVLFKLTEEDKIEDGEMQIEISGYKDIAGNEGKTLTNTDITGVTGGGQKRIVIDRTAPIIKLPQGVVGKNEDEIHIKAGTNISIDNKLFKPTVTDNIDSEPTLSIDHVDYLAGKGFEEENIYNYDITKKLNTTKSGARYNVYYKAIDKAGNPSEKVLLICIDYPTAKVTYSEDDHGNVTATLSASTPIMQPTGWERVNAQVIKKNYTNNTEETVTFKDLYGNEGTTNVKITNIDESIPNVTVEYSTKKTTNGDVIVTIDANKSVVIKTSGWSPAESPYGAHKKVKKYEKNTIEEVYVTDYSNPEKYRKVIIKIDNIDKELPTAELTYSQSEDGKITVQVNGSEAITMVTQEFKHKASGKVYIRTFDNKNDIPEIIEFRDLAGNINSCEVNLDNIVKSASSVSTLSRARKMVTAQNYNIVKEDVDKVIEKTTQPINTEVTNAPVANEQGVNAEVTTTPVTTEPVVNVEEANTPATTESTVNEEVVNTSATNAEVANVEETGAEQ